MDKPIQWLARRRWIAQIASLVVIVPVVGGLVLATRLGDEGQGTSWVALVLVAVFLIAVVLIVAGLLVMLAGVDPDAAHIANRLAAAPEQQRLLTRWLERTRWGRNVGGLAGITWWILGTSTQGNLLLLGVGGITIGSMLTQIHHARRPSGRRTASLDRRMVSEYLPVPWQRRMAAISVVAALMVMAGFVLDNAAAARFWGGAALVVLIAVHLVQRQVAARPRPALATGLRRADDLVRALAIDRGLAQPATYCGLALVAAGALSFRPAVGSLATAISVAAWLYALVLWWRNRRLGLDDLISRPESAPASA